ncbi:MAG: bifunctional phosphoribosyl-AMP cyclohydrolase/phosphoribosyl-ATP diphosphatase HisIE [Deltaproteobacteria bacterium]|nr:bifunctional phosphoribosyl-AMP cyclohydrolase/phosphoribosyl-ATP diphosphatase HisIE [Deltaproteobacteria bacterium]
MTTNIPNVSEMKFDEKGLIPAIAQDSRTGDVLMFAFMNKTALEQTLSSRKAHFYSRSRNSLWLKGETSGNVLDVDAVLYDCDADCVLVKVTAQGPACHTGERTCFYRRLDEDGPALPLGAGVIDEVFRVVEARKSAPADTSYVASLYAKGLEAIIGKVEEESGELVRAARDEGLKAVTHELVDLWFHTIVLLADRGVGSDAVFTEFGRRFGISGLDEKAARGKKPVK